MYKPVIVVYYHYPVCPILNLCAILSYGSAVGVFTLA